MSGTTEYLKRRGHLDEVGAVFRKWEGKLYNQDIGTAELKRLFNELVALSQLSDSESYRDADIAAALLADAYTNQLSTAEQTAFQTATGLS